LKKIAVIGGGASGLIAACFASGENNKLVLFEKQKKLGRKLLITGNGRCNITNKFIATENYHGNNPQFVNNILARFGLDETINFFLDIGIPFVEIGNGKLYPESLQSSTVTKFFEYELKKRCVDLSLHRRIDKIIPFKKKFKLITAGNEEHLFDSVILAAGSRAYPSVGGSRSGYDLAKSLGHTIYEPFPSILPLDIPLKTLHRLQGIKWDCEVSVVSDGKIVKKNKGELLFTGYGISGPAALGISRSVNEKVLSGKIPEIIIDFFPDLNQGKLFEKLDAMWTDSGKKVGFSMLGMIKDRMPDVLLEIAGVDSEKRIETLSKDDRQKIVSVLKGLTVCPGEPRNFDDAVVAAGGVDVNEVNPATMESKIIKNLFVTGELLDIDGDSGGYNLQFAWSTGAIAGLAQ